MRKIQRIPFSKSNPPGPKGPEVLAFGLLELIAVLAILGILAVLSLTAVQNARASAKQAQCASNMRQIGMALLNYAGDHQGELPLTAHTEGSQFERAWIFQLRDYLDDVDRVRICPAEPSAVQRARLENDGTSYVLNSFVFVPAIDPFGNVVGEPMNNVYRLPKPSRTIFAFIISERQATNFMADHVHAYNWNNWNRVLADIQPDRHRSGRAASDHTKGSANYLYADGRVENLLAKQLKTKIDSGTNPAEIPN